MKDRRDHERFSLQLPAKIEAVTPRERLVFDLQSDNVSAGGALFDTEVEIAVGTEVRINLTLPSERHKELTGAESLVKVRGKVVRSGPSGLAISFGKKYELLKLRNS